MGAKGAVVGGGEGIKNRLAAIGAVDLSAVGTERAGAAFALPLNCVVPYPEPLKAAPLAVKVPVPAVVVSKKPVRPPVPPLTVAALALNVPESALELLLNCV